LHVPSYNIYHLSCVEEVQISTTIPWQTFNYLLNLPLLTSIFRMATNRTADETVEAAFLSISSFLNSLHFLIQSSVFICPILYKFQMLQYTPDTNVLDILTQLMAKHEPLEYDFWRAMSMIGRQEPIWIIIDGFDESTESCQILIARLVELLTWTPKYRVIVLGRSYALMGAIQTTKFSIEMSSGLTKHDIDAYITAGVLKDTLLSKSELDASFSDVLKRKAGGKFLWAKLMINHLGRSANINEALKRLEDPPRGLKMAYIFQKNSRCRYYRPSAIDNRRNSNSTCASIRSRINLSRETGWSTGTENLCPVRWFDYCRRWVPQSSPFLVHGTRY
jgi:hypothetical protein